MQILVHEPTSHWTAELERSFADQPECTFRWRPYREELLEELFNASLVVLVVSPDDKSLDLIRTLKTLNSQIAIASLFSPHSAEWEWLARELGAEIVLPAATEKARVTYSIKRLLLE